MHFLIVLALALVIPGGSAVAQDDVRAVKVAAVVTEDGGLQRQFFGQVVARQTVDLAFQVGGRIVDLPAIEGETVAKGALVAQLDLEPFQRALDQARLQQDQADRNVRRLEQLSGSTVSQVTIDDAITQAGLAGLSMQTAEYNLEQATILAPFDGLIAARNVANFTTINAGEPIVRLHDMSEVRIEIDVPEILIQSISDSSQVTVVARFPFEDRDFPLEVREINAETTTIGQTYRVTLGMVRPEDFMVLPGSSATVIASIERPEIQLIVPVGAVRIAPDGSTSVFRYVGEEAGRVEEVPVLVSPTDNGAVAVDEGLSAGDEIVVAGVAKLTDGQAVRRFTGFGN